MKSRYILFYFILLGLLFILPHHQVFAKNKDKKFSFHYYKTPALALKKILKNKPLIIGFGEYHQLLKFSHITSSIERFNSQMLSSLKGIATDLLLETWIVTGKCGKVEKRVVKKIAKTIRRPQKTKNHIRDLLIKAKTLGMGRHLIRIHCKIYRTMLDKKGHLDQFRLLQFVTKRLYAELRAINFWRRKIKMKPVVMIYGGAIHNDIIPEKDLAQFSYVTYFSKKLKKHYIEVDLFVPEYIFNDEDLKKESWYPLFLKHQSTTQTLLIKRSPQSYVLIFPWQKKLKK